ncbi:flagellar basal body P-ring protein FlgI [Gilvimarinus japonicus]|jgi:flagellar P-ring protein precursor FlgI|uniref:Flagellar P-ring protein n=1 Tax=Gilvimarinus japonicus TaxID=1796469 RepID=A0ABV7HUU7_9GAMM
MKTLLGLLLSSFFTALLLSAGASAERVKDIASVAGVRSNQLIGYGLVVGLDGTGDQTTQSPFTTQSFSNMLKQFGINVPEGTRMQMKNVAAVMIHADLPAFAKPGQAIDITVSSVSNAKSLRGGTLLMSKLKGIDGNTYAVAQGSLVVGGFGVEAGDGSNITVNVPSVGRIPNGATVERSVPNNFTGNQPIVFNLNRADFTTANRLATAINEMLGPDVAAAIDAVSVAVKAPQDPAHRVDFMALLENIEVKPGEEAARVVINSRTGTIVVGQHVRVSPVAITHGSLTVSISEDYDVSQPGAFAQGQTAITPNSAIDVEEETNPMFKFAPGSTLEDIVRSVNNVGASPADLMAILEALKQSGALNAELLVI